MANKSNEEENIRMIRICMAMAVLIFVCTFGGMRVEAATQSYANVVVFAYLSGAEEEADSAYFSNTDKVTRIMNIYEGSSKLSVKNYLSTISNNQLEIKNIFPQYDEITNSISIMKLSVSKEAANYGDVDAEIVREVIEKLKANYSVSGTLDYNSDDALDNLTIILVGGDDSGADGSIYPHMTVYAGSQTINNKLVRSYNILNTYRIMGLDLAYYKGGDEAGVICHEFLHTLGFTDLYKYDSSDSSNPVFTWSIMGSNGRYLQYPLAYERMYFGRWLTLPEITESGNYVVDPQTTVDGNPAYIIKSPLNDREFFVIEYRKKSSSENELEYKIGYPGEAQAGLIVYRVNTSVEGMSNKTDKDAFYVFRPQEGQPGYNAEYPTVSCINASLSAESGRTTIGSSDMSATLKDGALTFSDGTNSGIVVSTTSSGKGDSMTVTVTLPDLSAYTIWRDEAFTGTAVASYEYKASAATEAGGKLYVAEHISTTKAITIRTYNSDTKTWTVVGNSIASGTSMIYVMKMFEFNNSPYIIFDSNGKYYCYGLVSGKWVAKGSFTTDYDIDVCTDSVTGQVYVAYIDNNYYLTLCSYNGTSFTKMASVLKDWSSGLPKVDARDGYITVGVRDSCDVVLYEYKSGQLSLLSSSITTGGKLNGTAYDITYTSSGLYVTVVYTYSDTNKSATIVYKHSAEGWIKVSELESDSFADIPSYTIGDDILYLMGCGSAENTYVAKYSSSNNSMTEIGLRMDVGNEEADFAVVGDRVYVEYRVQQTVTVKSLKLDLIIDTKEPEAEDTVEQLEALVAVRGYSLTVTDDGKIGLKVRLAVPMKLTLADYTVVTKVGELPENISNLATLSNTTKESITSSDRKTRYYLIYDLKVYVDAKMQGEEIFVALKKGDQYITEGTVSIKAYSEYLIENSEIYELTDKQVKLIKALLNYGAAAQVYFDYNTSKPVNSGLDQVDRNVADISDDIKKLIVQMCKSEGLITQNSNAKDIEYIGSSLLLGADICIRHYLKFDNEELADNYMYYTADLVSGERTYLDIVKLEGTDMYYVELPPVKCGEYTIDRNLYIVNNASTDEALTEYSIGYNVFAYYAAVLDSGAAVGNEKFENLLVALYNLHRIVYE